MSIKKVILLVAFVLSTLAICETAQADTQLDKYEKTLKKKEKSLNSLNKEIRGIRVAIKTNRQYVKTLDTDIEQFSELIDKLSKEYVIEKIYLTSFTNYEASLKQHKKEALKEIQGYNNQLKNKYKKRKKLRKSIKSIKKKIDNIKKKSFNGVLLSYSDPYYVSSNQLTKSKGVVRFNGHRETYYSQRVLPGTGLKIPGRHVAKDGTVRDKDGYICVAANPSFYSRYSVLMTSLGPARVYDCGCAYGTIDVYCNW